MSRPPRPTTFKLEDFKEQASWIDRLIRPLNSFMSDATTSLNGGLSLETNVDAHIQELYITASDPVTDSFPLYFSVKTRGRCRTVTIGSCENADDPSIVFSSAVFPTWSFTSDGRVKISYITGLSAGSNYRIRFLCLA